MATSVILIVEDDVDLREEVADELRDCGYEVLEANNGLEATEIIAAQPPDLIVSDISMLGMNGYALVHDVRSGPEATRNTPIILLSALADAEHMRKGLESGANDYLKKPVNIDVLLGKIRSYLPARATVFHPCDTH